MEVVVKEAPAVVDEVSPSDTNSTTNASTEPLIHNNESFLGGPTRRSVLTGYTDHVTFCIWQGEVYMLYFLLKITHYDSIDYMKVYGLFF